MNGRVTWNITPMVTIVEGLTSFLGTLCHWCRTNGKWHWTERLQDLMNQEKFFLVGFSCLME